MHQAVNMVVRYHLQKLGHRDPVTSKVFGGRPIPISLKSKYEMTQRCTTSTGFEQVRRQSLLDFYLIQTCSRSTMKAIARARLPTPERCALFALQKRGLAFNFSPPGLMQGRSTCIVSECPEFETLTSLKKDLRYDYYSLYGNPLRKYHTVTSKGDCRRSMDWMIGFIALIHSNRNYNWYSAIADLHTLQFTVTHTLRFSGFSRRILATDFNTVIIPLSL
jgi:hypothetical protein